MSSVEAAPTGPAYVYGNGTTGNVDLSTFDKGGGVSYSAGAGDKTIDANTSNPVSIDTGSGNDRVRLGSGDSVINIGSGVNQIACGDGQDTFIFNAGSMAHTADGGINNIIGFAGAGVASSSAATAAANADKDFIWLRGFGAGAQLTFSGFAVAGSQQVQYYTASDNAGHTGMFVMSMKQNASGGYNLLNADTDYAFATW